MYLCTSAKCSCTCTQKTVNMWVCTTLLLENVKGHCGCCRHGMRGQVESAIMWDENMLGKFTSYFPISEVYFLPW